MTTTPSEFSNGPSARASAENQVSLLNKNCTASLQFLKNTACSEDGEDGLRLDPMHTDDAKAGSN